MKQIIFSLIFLMLSVGIFSQNKHIKNINEAQELSKKITSLFKENKISIAIKELKPYWPLPESEVESFESKTIKYINIIEERYGKSIGFLKVKNQTISDIAVRETYIVKYVNSAIRLIFTYYKNNDGWIVNAFKWDDSFEKEFK